MQLGAAFIILHQLIARQRIRPAVRQPRLYRPQRGVVFAGEGLMFVIQGLTKRDIGWIARVAAPMFFVMLAAVIMLYVWPQIVLWLPSHM